MKKSILIVGHTPGHHIAKQIVKEQGKIICPLCNGEGREKSKHNLCETCRRDHYEDGDRTGKN